MKKKTRGIIACGHSQTAEAAQIIFEEGGNAYDAAIAAILASAVTEPCLTSLGGGGFMNTINASGKQMVFDFFCQTPSKKRAEKDLDFYATKVDYGTSHEFFHIGLGAMAVPGILAGIFKIYEDFASLPMKVLIEPAWHYAKKGWVVNEFQAMTYQILGNILEIHPDAQKVFLKDGKILEAGAIQHMELCADFLEHLASEGKDNFYRGDIAQQIVQDCQALGGHLSFEDFEKYEVKVRKPLSFVYRNKTILCNPNPSVGGQTMQHLFGALAKQNIPHWETAEHTQMWYELIEKTLGAKQLILEDIANNKWGSTTQISLLDEWGNAVSVTTSNGEGSGYMIPHTGVMMNNMLGESALLPNGWHSWVCNQRLSSMMNPSIVLDEAGEVMCITGTGGAARIPFAIAQVIHFLIDHQMEVMNAVQMPRIYFEKEVLNLEPNVPQPNNLVGDHQILQWDKQAMFFGGVHSILKKDNRISAYGDSRRSGVAVGEI